jgi:hypothetical protein
VGSHAVRNGNGGLRLVGAGCKLLPIIVVIAVLSVPCIMQGQRNSGRSHGPLICIHDCRTGDDGTPDDGLKDFNQLLALQGTPEQTGALLSLAGEVQLAKNQIRPLAGKALASPNISDTVALVDKSVAKLHTETQVFLGSFSPAQKSGLKDLAKRVEEADAELGKQVIAFDELVKGSTTADQRLSDCAGGVDKALSNVERGQVALASEMGIILPSTELTFSLTSASSVSIGTTAISVPVAADITRTSSADNSNAFVAKIVADLSDLQDKISEILRTQMEQSHACGERTEVQESMLVPDAPASRIFTRVHVERWICPPTGRGEPMEVASGEGSLELKLIPSIEEDGKFGLNSQISHVDGNDFARDLLVGNVGQMLKDKITSAIASSVQKAAESQFVPTFPGESATMDKAQFQQAGARLTLVVNEHVRLSDQQTQEFATRVKQYLSAQQRSSP